MLFMAFTFLPMPPGPHTPCHLQAIFAKGYGTVMDSGTTFSYFPTAVFAAFVSSLDTSLEGKGLAKGGGPDPSVSVRWESNSISIGGATLDACWQLC